MSIFDAFEYVLNYYSPYGREDELQCKDSYAVISIQDGKDDTLIIHCYAEKSRSRAVGVFA